MTPANAPVVEAGDAELTSGMKALDLTPLSHLTSVGTWFLYRCAGLTALDLGPLAQLTSVGDGFLLDCASLTALDLTPLAL